MDIGLHLISIEQFRIFAPPLVQFQHCRQSVNGVVGKSDCGFTNHVEASVNIVVADKIRDLLQVFTTLFYQAGHVLGPNSLTVREAMVQRTGDKTTIASAGTVGNFTCLN